MLRKILLAVPKLTPTSATTARRVGRGTRLSAAIARSIFFNRQARVSAFHSALAGKLNTQHRQSAMIPSLHCMSLAVADCTERHGACAAQHAWHHMVVLNRLSSTFKAGAFSHKFR